MIALCVFVSDNALDRTSFFIVKFFLPPPTTACGKMYCVSNVLSVSSNSAFLISGNTNLADNKAEFVPVRSFTRFAGSRHSPMSAERREIVGEGGSSGKSTPNWSRLEEGGGAERGSTGEYILLRNSGVNTVNGLHSVA